MARLLMLYGTTDGQTVKVARFLADELRAKGANVDLYDARKTDPDPRRYTAVLVAASVHAGGYQRSVVRWVRRHLEALQGRPSAFVSVCLGILQKDLKAQRELGVIANRFESLTGWKPLRIKFVAGALPYTRYNWLKRMVMRHIVKQAGGDTDVSRDYEYTDWGDLQEFAGAFAAMFRVTARCEAPPREATPREERILTPAG